MGYIKEHWKGFLATCVGVIIMVIVIVASSIFIMDSKDKVTMTAELSMEDPEGNHIQFGGFTRDDGNISLTFTGNITLFGGVRGSAQGNIEEMGGAAGGRLIKIADPIYDRTLALRAAHYTTYVIVPEAADVPFGSWAVAVVDDNQAESTVLFWMDLREDGTVVVDRADSIQPSAEWASEIGGAWAEEMTWTRADDGTFAFSDGAGRTFTFRCE